MSTWQSLTRKTVHSYAEHCGFMTKNTFIFLPVLAACVWLTVTFFSENTDPMARDTSTPIGQIELERIPQQEIRDFILSQIENDITSFQEITPTFLPGNSLDGYKVHEKEYQVEQPQDYLLDHYLSANPGKAWNGGMLSFGLMVSKKDEAVMYKGDAYQGAQVGQVLFVNVEVLGGLIKVPVAHEIIDINRREGYFEISYVKGGKSAGMQRISFLENKDGSTTIHHKTYYRSASDFRDKFIYPLFHTMAIDEYHHNMLGSLPGQTKLPS